VTGPTIARQLVRTLLVLGGLVWAAAPVPAQDLLRVSRNVPGDSKRIVLYADEVTTWIDGTHRIVVLKGMVLAEQSVCHVRMQGGIAWIDLERQRKTGILHVDLYAEGNVLLENQAVRRQGARALLDLNTRGELKLKAQKGKIVQQPKPQDGLYQRALAEAGPVLGLAVAPVLQRTSGTEAAPGQPQVIPAVFPPPPNPPPSGPATPAPSQPSPSAPPPPQETAAAIPGETSERLNADPTPGTADVPTVPPPATTSVVARSEDLAPTNADLAATRPAPQETASLKLAAGEQPDPNTATIVPVQATGPPGSAPASGPNPPGVEPGPPVPGAVVAPSGPATGTPPVAPLVPGGAPAAPTPGIAPGPPRPTAPPSPPRPRQVRVMPRSSLDIQAETIKLDGEQAILVTGGVILSVQGAPGVEGLLDIEADQAVIWSQGDLQQLFSGMRSAEGQSTNQVEFYLAGNVVIRSQTRQDSTTLRADEVYYDVARHVAVAHNADLELRPIPRPGKPIVFTDPIHFRAEVLQQLAENEFRGYRALIFSSRLPSDPGLKIYVKEATLENKEVPKTSIFGRQFINRQTGLPETETERLIRANNVFLKIEDIPILYTPYLQGDANDPLGPLESINFGYNRSQFEFMFSAVFNVYDLLGIDPVAGTSWKADVDYFSRRGPAAGTDFNYNGKDLCGVPGKSVGEIKAFGINDTATDVLGGGRGEFEPHPDNRGWFYWRHYGELPDDFTLNFQISVLSDKNFLEQYFKDTFDLDRNQETFIYLKQQRDNWAWTVLTQEGIRNWVTETSWLPRADGYLLGQPLLDWFSYNAHASAGYARLRTPDVPPPPYEPTDVNQSTARLDLIQELSVPFTLGPVKVVPYGVLDLTYYSRDLNDQERGRFYVAGGVRTSMPLTRLYPDVHSEFLNLDGLNHKIVLSTNYYVAHSDTPFTLLPQLDRLSDDASDQSLRDINPLEPVFVGGTTGNFLKTSPIFDVQTYAIRRLLTTAVDTLDSIEALQLDIRQRLQTKRGYPGQEHIVDWMTLDVSATYFPRADRDNFGESFNFFAYDWVWNIGDRTALVSSGWFDPTSDGARVFNVGAYLNRPDRTNFYIGYREIDPLNTQELIANVNYVISPKYAISASVSYDFGNQIQSNSVNFTRMGSDLQVTLGLGYNSTLNSFSFTFEIFPNLVPENRRTAALGSSTFAKQ
jgi:hypothetical protein